jgi:hypothetical protein
MQAERQASMDAVMHAVDECSQQAGTFYSRAATRSIRSFLRLALTKVPDGLRRLVQRALTGDQAAAGGSNAGAVDERLQLAIDSGGELLPDLRVLNGGAQRERQASFWAAMEAVLGEVAQAAHERRHGEAGASYLSELLSVPQLMRRVRTRLEAEHGADLAAVGIDIPSESWVALQFLPKNKHSHTALNYTGRWGCCSIPGQCGGLG